MNKKIRDILFLLICIGSAFRWIPFLYYSNLYGKTIGLLSGGSAFSLKLMFIPLLLGILYTIYCYCVKKDHTVLVLSREVIIFAAAYLILMVLSVIWGSVQFPFISQILHGSADYFQNIDKARAIMDGLGIHMSDGSFLLFYIGVKTIKNTVLEFIWQFGGVYLIYCWYRNDKERLLKVLTLGVTVVVLVECFVTGLEALEMAGNKFALHILANITPLFHPVGDMPGGRLWWSGQFRGTFTEPSFYGMFCAFAIPFLWYQLIHRKDKRVKAFYALLSLDIAFSIFMTSSRTAIGLFLAEVILLFILGLSMQNKRLLAMVCMTVALNILGVGLGNCYMGHLMMPRMREIATFNMSNSGKVHKREAAKSVPKVKSGNQQSKVRGPTKQPNPSMESSTLRGYFERNVLSLTDANKRSNRSRFTINLTNIRIGLDHPILGVGRGLRQPYITQYLKGQKLNGEINKWLRMQKENGLLKDNFPNLGDYAVHFAEGGILGLIAFLVIPVILLIRLAKGVVKEKNFLYGIVLISLIGSMAVGLGDSLTILYVYWLLLGVGCALTASSDVTEKSEKVNS